jgi:hypothetical protein
MTHVCINNKSIKKSIQIKVFSQEAIKLPIVFPNLKSLLIKIDPGYLAYLTIRVIGLTLLTTTIVNGSMHLFMCLSGQLSWRREFFTHTNRLQFKILIKIVDFVRFAFQRKGTLLLITEKQSSIN